MKATLLIRATLPLLIGLAACGDGGVVTVIAGDETDDAGVRDTGDTGDTFEDTSTPDGDLPLPDEDADDDDEDAPAAATCPSPDALDRDVAASVSVPRQTACDFTLTIQPGELVEYLFDPQTALEVTFDGRPPTQPGWIAPLRAPGEHTLRLTNPADAAVSLTFERSVYQTIEGVPEIDRSLVWTSSDILDTAPVTPVDVLQAIVPPEDDVKLRALIRAWFRRFATTAHSERIGPQLLIDELDAQSPDGWALEELPFKITAIHNRIDLAADGHCGEFRVSLASTHPIYQPLHIILLFRQPAQSTDISPDGAVTHCRVTASRWALLTGVEDDDFAMRAFGTVLRAMTYENFLLAETVDFTVSPWEWRQWLPTPTTDPTLPYTFENPPLFQTVDTERLNAPGPDRDDFIAFVEENAASLDARTQFIPERFRARSARVNAGVPWIPLDLTGVSSDVLEALPDLRRNIEIVGCPGCHSADAEFVQTLPDRTFSPFYTKELDARQLYLDALLDGVETPPPFGPMQDEPVLTP